MAQRVIKFRGKNAHSNAWCYGSLVEEDDARVICGFDVFQEGRSEWMEVPIDYDTAGQFTGMFDEDGKEIYEGDIVIVKSSVRYKVVTFNSGCFVAGEWTLSFYGEDNMKVIGNIHDNPELL